MAGPGPSSKNANNVEGRYALSFTSGALLIREALVAAPVFLEIGDWAATQTRLREENLLQARTPASALRLAREVTQRLSVFNKAELELLCEATASEVRHLMWVAACRRYAFIGDFAEEVLRERFLLLTSSLGHEEFDSFLRSKALWHPELEELQESTLKKLRATLFRMMHEADLVVAGHIAPALLSPRVRMALDSQVPSDIRFFPTQAHTEVS